METIHAFFANPLVRRALAGVVVAAQIDYAAFRSWKNFDDALHYDWKTAAWRWTQGAIVGLIAGSAIDSI